ncbi:Alpha/beta hydrolase fold [Parasponia andersonii]|uniref:Alpha/beta hydrolase fold n=1 Tax=Parasponia andersonii TaxID=3476 RepID=A0A2P5CSX3_PARAD|nr:Alpha/beta hydrolase fold [Parasponia andersonii]
MASTSSLTPFSKIDFSKRAEKVTLIQPSLSLSKITSLPRKIYGFSGIKSDGFVVFSRLNDPVAEKSLASSTNNGSELQVRTRMWNWRGYSIRYQYSGTSGPALVLIHGFGANSDHWRKNIPVLAKSHRVYSIDLIGYGYSDKPNPRQFGDTSFYTFETWATQLNDFCKEVVKDEAFFICNSIGGVVGLQAAVMEPKICKGIMLLNISLRMLHIKKQPWFGRPFIRSFQNLLRSTAVGQYFFKSVATPEAVRNILSQCYHDTTQVTEELVQSILLPGLEPGAADVFLEFICYSGGPLPEELLPQVKCPVLIAWGDKDPWEPIELGRAFKNFDSVEDFVVLPSVGHCPQDEAPTLVNPLVESFVARHAASSAGLTSSTSS